MGMDVYGKNADRKSGRYFRNSVWWWHPLWEYCAMISEVAAAVEQFPAYLPTVRECLERHSGKRATHLLQTEEKR